MTQAQQAQPASESPDEILTPEDVEREYKLKRGTQDSMRSRGQIPFFRLGGGKIIRYSRRDLTAWLADRMVPVDPTTARLESRAADLLGKAEAAAFAAIDAKAKGDAA